MTALSFVWVHPYSQNSGCDIMKIDVWFPSNTYTVLDSINIRKKINTAIRDIYKRYDSFVQRGSGWVL